MTLALDGLVGADVAGATVADAMIGSPKLCDADTTVGHARADLGQHVHALLVVTAGRLVAVVDPDDLLGAASGQPVRELGRLEGRTVRPGDGLLAVAESMVVSGRRRLAVVDGDGRLLGLLCRQRSGRGFCSDEGVAARAAERAAG